MKTIYKYELLCADSFSVDMPAGAKLLDTYGFISSKLSLDQKRASYKLRRTE